MATYSPTLLNDSRLYNRETWNHLTWAIAVSIALHVIAALVLPNIKLDMKEPPESLIVELAPAKQTAPEPVIEPEQIPEPTPVQQPKIKPEPVVKPKLQPAPSPIAEPPPSTQSENINPPSPPPVITAAPKAEVTPTFTAPPPPPEPPKPTGPSQQDIDAARSQYGNLLTRELAKHKQYPKIAQMRGWQGDVVLELQLDSNGNLLSAKVHDASGFDALDKQALEMAKKAAPFPLPPEALRGRSFTILAPVAFHLEN